LEKVRQQQHDATMQQARKRAKPLNVVGECGAFGWFWHFNVMIDPKLHT
jgi:hypothetical protein